MDWRNQTVLVTGAGGFIGSHLTERLVELGAETRAFFRYKSDNSWGWLERSSRRSDIRNFHGDLLDTDTLKNAIQGVDIVFHLAALIAIPYSYTASISYLRTNAEGTLNVLRVAAELGSKLVVHTSTSEVYGTADYVPITEEHPLKGQSPYSASKIAADKLAEAFHCSFGLPVATLRPFNTYGPRQSSRAVIPSVIGQFLTKPAVRVGNLEPTRDFNYVADTVAAFIRTAETPDAVGKTIHVGTGRETSIAELLKIVGQLTGKSPDIVCEPERLRPENSEVFRLCANNDKARSILSWQPAYRLEDGLKLTIDWIEANSGRYEPDVYIR